MEGTGQEQDRNTMALSVEMDVCAIEPAGGLRMESTQPKTQTDPNQTHLRE